MSFEVVTGPAVAHVYDVMQPSRQHKFRGRPGASLRELAPVTAQATLCVYNGDYVLPEDMDWVPNELDHVAYVVLPKGGGNASQTVLGLVLIVVGIFTSWAGGGYLVALGAALLVSGLMPVPEYTPIGQTNAEAASPTYSLNVGGNSARLGMAIPVFYGRHILVPDYASQPYAEFRSGNQQYFHALMCLGAVVDFDVEAIMIDDTNINHFTDVEYSLHGPNHNPLDAINLLHPMVVNCSEIAQQDLNYGEYVGPFAVCGPGLKLVAICIDVIMPQGLFYAADNGSLGSKSISWFVEARRIDDNNAALSAWSLLGSETYTAATNTPVRLTYKYDAPQYARYEVRMSRQDPRDTNVRAGHNLQWAGCRGFLIYQAPDPRCTYLAVRIRATSQLSGLSQRKFAVIVKRKLPTWSTGGGWTAPVATSSIAWALADVLRNTVYGGQLADMRIDLASLEALNEEWTERNDQFNGIFDKRITVWQALTTIARAGRARPVMRGSVFTFVRDNKQDLPVAMFSMRNIKKGSFNIEYSLRSEEESDGIEVEYFDDTSWSSRYVSAPVPGVEVVDMINPIRISLPGVTKAAQATREAYYMIADATYRRTRLTFTTEAEGFLPSYGDPILVAHDLGGWGVSGDVEFYDADLDYIVVTEDLPWGEGTFYCVLVGPQGDVFGPYRVAPGPEARSMQFLDLPEVGAAIYYGTERERTRFAMGLGTNYAKLCKVTGITPKNEREVEIRATVEDDRVHTADEDVPDSGGGGGGAGGRAARYAPDGVPNYNEASDTQQNSYGFYSDQDKTVGTVNDEGYVYS